MKVLVALILLFFILAVVLRATKKPTLFIVEFEEGRATVRKGKVSARFLRDCEELCRSLQIKKGMIQAVKDLEGVRLLFSKEIPEAYHQRFRNVWRMHTDDRMM